MLNLPDHLQFDQTFLPNEDIYGKECAVIYQKESTYMNCYYKLMDKLTNPQFIPRIQFYQSFKHNALPQIIDYGCRDTFPYYVTPKYQYRLIDVLQNYQITILQKLEILFGIVDCLVPFHEQLHYHGDLSINNIDIRVVQGSDFIPILRNFSFFCNSPTILNGTFQDDFQGLQLIIKYLFQNNIPPQLAVLQNSSLSFSNIRDILKSIQIQDCDLSYFYQFLSTYYQVPPTVQQESNLLTGQTNFNPQPGLDSDLINPLDPSNLDTIPVDRDAQKRSKKLLKDHLTQDQLFEFINSTPDYIVRGRAYFTLGLNYKMINNGIAKQYFEESVRYGFSLAIDYLKRCYFNQGLKIEDLLTFLKGVSDNLMKKHYPLNYIKKVTSSRKFGSIPSCYAYMFRKNLSKIKNQNTVIQKNIEIFPYIQWGIQQKDFFAYFVLGEALYYGDLPTYLVDKTITDNVSLAVNFLKESLALQGQCRKSIELLLKYYTKINDLKNIQIYSKLLQDINKSEVQNPGD